MNDRIPIWILLATALLVAPATAHARWMSPNTGRFQTMDTYEGSPADPASLHKYLYSRDNPINLSDPTGKDVYKVQYKSSFVVLDHRVIVGDTGTNYSGSCYIFDFWGDEGVLFGSKYEPIKYGVYHYRLDPAPAEATARRLIQDAGRGKVDAIVKTSSDVDKIMNESAAKLDGKRQAFVILFNDCGTGANRFLMGAVREQRRRHPLTYDIPAYIQDYPLW